MRKDWERQKEKLFEELGRHQASGSTQSFDATPRRKGAGGGFDRGVRFGPRWAGGLVADLSFPLQSPAVPAPSAGSSLQMHSRMMRYDRVVRRLNDFRKEGYAFGLVSALGEASAGTAGDSVSLLLFQAFSHVVDAPIARRNPHRPPRPSASSLASSTRRTSSTASSSVPLLTSANTPRPTSPRTRRGRQLLD